MNTPDISPIACYLMSLAPSGRRSMHSQLNQVAAILNEEDAEKVEWHKLEYQQLIFVRSKLQETSKSVNTINTTMAAIKGVVKTAFKMDLVSADHLAKIAQIGNVRGSARSSGMALSVNESRKLVQTAASIGGDKSARDSAILILMLTAGLRRSEVVSLTIGSVDLDKGSVAVLGKGGKLRHHDISGVALKQLKRWVQVRNEEDTTAPFFTKILKAGTTEEPITPNTVYRLVKKYGEAIGIEGLRPHDLRRSYISLLLEQGSDLNLVSQAAGHANVATTSRYDRRHVSAQTQAMRQLTDNIGRGLEL